MVGIPPSYDKLEFITINNYLSMQPINQTYINSFNTIFWKIAQHRINDIDNLFGNKNHIRNLTHTSTTTTQVMIDTKNIMSHK